MFFVIYYGEHVPSVRHLIAVRPAIRDVLLFDIPAIRDVHKSCSSFINGEPVSAVL
jgi:hypothetical protein